MASSLVDRATSSMLIGHDWAMNTEICEILNRDIGQARDVVKSVKRRLRSKNPKVQLLTLTLLETLIKNCGDIVHMHVAEKNVLQLMVKMVKKKPDFRVKEKILVLIDTWQEAFGGPRARYPQYYAAYQELLHAGAVFPQRTERTAPIFPQPGARPGYTPEINHEEAAESSGIPDLPNFSLTEVQNAREVMDVLAEMLSALDPANKEGLKEEIIVDLVEQCRSYKRRVFHLVNTTSDEALLSAGLALNDDLQRVLAKHDAIAAGIAVREERPKTPPALVDIGEPASKTEGTSKETNGRSDAGADTSDQHPFDQLLLTAPPSSNEKSGTANRSAMSAPDLLSWDDAPASDNLALVPVTETLASSSSENNVLALSDMFSSVTNNTSSSLDSHSSFPQQQTYPSTNGLQVAPVGLHSNGDLPEPGASQLGQMHYAQGSQVNNANSVLNDQAQGFSLQQPSAAGLNDQSEGDFPLPPWETQAPQENQLSISQPQAIQNTNPGGFYAQTMQMPQQPSQAPGAYPYAMQEGQMQSMHPQQATQPGQMTGIQPAAIQSGQMASMYQQQAMQGGQGMYPQHVMQGGQMTNMYPQAMQMQGGQMVGMYPQQMGMHPQQAMQGGQFGGYAYSQQQSAAQFYGQTQRPAYPYATPNGISHGMSGLSMYDNGGQVNMNPSYQMSSSSSIPLQKQPMRPAKPEDKLFGDLVNIAKVKPGKP